MLRRLEERNRKLWSDHPTMLEDVTHVLGGIGLGLLLYPMLKRKAKPTAWAMVLISTALHFYADTVKPRTFGTAKPRVKARSSLAEAIRARLSD